MKIFSKKITFLVGSIIGSAVGMLFASESGKTLRTKIHSARNPQKKFEVFFQEYLRAGKSVVKEVQDNEVLKEVLAGGKEIAAELSERAKVEGSAAVKYAKEKTDEVIRDIQKHTGSNITKMRKKIGVKRAAVKTIKAKAKKIIKKKPLPRKK